ncbi:MAG: ABC-type antimicrobial peptide transport system, ATPase component [Anaerocolumna sp.]|jgi:putative ABC transport system ATP-binding protein|nr:ABC-type antimicrobial peptide transport system, ATPase component [Anaerocolumna sp.]
MNTKYILKTNHVKRFFPIAGGENFYALKDISIKIPEGSMTILRGRSGSGKTTLMNILGALDKPNEGEVFFDDQNIVTMNEKQREIIRRNSIGFVFQSVSLIPMMTAYENVEYALRLAGIKENRKKRTEECLKLVGLTQRMHHMPQELSGGEQQRVAIARAIAHKPKVIFADEPTAELDSNTGLQIIKIFKDLIMAEGVTIVMTTHDVSIMGAGDVVYELGDGEIINGNE